MLRDTKQLESLDELLEVAPSMEPVESSSPDSVVESKITLAAVGDALAQLPTQLRHTFVLRYQYDLSYADIATVTGQTEGAVKMQLFRAREKLRTLLYDQTAVQGGM
jgi:RNA polymerase sigma-70 factor (ECF subfamily)